MSDDFDDRDRSSDIKPDTDEERALKQALRETSDVLEYQFELAQSAESDILRIVRLNLLVLGAIIPLITNVRDLIISSLEYLFFPYFLVIFSLFSSVYIYQSSPLYVGFSDSPNMDYETTFAGEKDVTFSSFAHDLLVDHEKGILHNNTEIKYRITIYRLSVILVILAIFLISLGLLLSMTSKEIESVLLVTYALCSFVSLLPIVSSLRRMCEFSKRYEDDQRLDYEYYGHTRVYQLRKFICGLLER